MAKKLRKIQPQTFDEMHGMESKPVEKKFLPKLNVNEEQMPEIKKWETGKDYYILVKVNQTGKRDEKDSLVSAEFDITHYMDMTAKFNKKIEDMDDNEFSEHQSEMLDKASKDPEFQSEQLLKSSPERVFADEEFKTKM